jgi:Kazal-type serine protease inhibitor domain
LEAAVRRFFVVVASLGVLASAADVAGAAKLGEACGGSAGTPCDRGLWCEAAAGQCRTANAPGTCVRAGEICYQLYQPVCGCNGRTYSNDCTRRQARLAKDHDGAC